MSSPDDMVEVALRLGGVHVDDGDMVFKHEDCQTIAAAMQMLIDTAKMMRRLDDVESSIPRDDKELLAKFLYIRTGSH